MQLLSIKYKEHKKYNADNQYSKQLLRLCVNIKNI